jgi:6-pyruvoyltetrahydropterin/6-carboxytetrahydropterin synthase
MAHTVIHLERTIDASHVIPGHPGKCGRLHGHTYRIQAWLSGPVADDGMVVDFYDVKAAIDEWDHRHLNDVVDFIPTAELLAAELQRRLLALVQARNAADTPGVAVLVRLWETPSSWAQVGSLAEEHEVGATTGTLVAGVH